MAALGFMAELVKGATSWWTPTLAGQLPEVPALLPYWLGAWSMQMGPVWASADFMARIPFALLLTLALVATWYGTYYLARTPSAQPVAFAFGGEALPTDYARAIADGGLLALIACLGLAQLSHETTPTVAQLGFSGLLFYALAALPYRRWRPLAAAATALVGLSLSGAPVLASVLGIGGALLHAAQGGRQATTDDGYTPFRSLEGLVIVALSLLGLALAAWLGLVRWKLDPPSADWQLWYGHAQLLIWFTWPTWPLALWTLWRWRRQLLHRNFSYHIALPSWFVASCVASALWTDASDRSLLLALPPLAALAAFALPTLKRQVAALIDWFTLLFFSGCGLTIWVVWIAMQTGVPAQPAANVARLAPGFEAPFSTVPFLLACLATLAWAWLVKWRVGRHQAAIWKSLVLPAGGASLSWFLLMTLWMPLLNYTQSYAALVARTTQHLSTSGCVEILGLSQGQIAALGFYGSLQLRTMQASPVCPWLLVDPLPDQSIPPDVDQSLWRQSAWIRHPAYAGESLLLFSRR